MLQQNQIIFNRLIVNDLSVHDSVPSTTHTIAQPPSGPAYAVAAGGQTHNTQGIVSNGLLSF